MAKKNLSKAQVKKFGDHQNSGFKFMTLHDKDGKVVKLRTLRKKKLK